MKKLALMLIIVINFLTLSLAAFADTKTAQVAKPSAVTITSEKLTNGCRISWKENGNGNRSTDYNVYYIKVPENNNKSYTAKEIIENGTIKNTSFPPFELHPESAGQEGMYAFVVTAVDFGTKQESEPSNVITTDAKWSSHFSY